MSTENFISSENNTKPPVQDKEIHIMDTEDNRNHDLEMDNKYENPTVIHDKVDAADDRRSDTDKLIGSDKDNDAKNPTVDLYDCAISSCGNITRR